MQVSWCQEDEFDSSICHVFCGGSIYNERTIITAAHCCDAVGPNNDIDWEDTKIVAGELHLLEESGFEQVRKIKSHIKHPDYNPSTLKNDICLLTLDSPLDLNENVKRIYLDVKDPVVDATCQVSGWGDQNVSIQLHNFTEGFRQHYSVQVRKPPLMQFIVH